MALNVKFLRFCKQSCIQFIIIKPAMAILNIVMLSTGEYHSTSYQVVRGIIYNVAYTLALYGLLLFYLSTKQDIRAYSPVRKFFAVKIVIFATYWQGLAVSFAPGLEPKTAELWNDFILCLEMSVFAVVHLYSFPWWEFRTGIPSSKELVAQNAKRVLSFKDVVRDVHHNIAPKYQTYVLQSNDGTVRKHKTKTFLVGNLDDPARSSRFVPDFNGLTKKYGGSGSAFSQKKGGAIGGDEFDDDSHFDATETEATELEYDHRMVHDDRTSDDAEERTERAHSNGVDSDHPAKIFEDFGDLNAEDIRDPNDALIPSKGSAEAANGALITPDSSTNLLVDDRSKLHIQQRFQLIDVDNVNVHSEDNDGDVESDPEYEHNRRRPRGQGHEE